MVSVKIDTEKLPYVGDESNAKGGRGSDEGRGGYKERAKKRRAPENICAHLPNSQLTTFKSSSAQANLDLDQRYFSGPRYAYLQD